MYAQQEKSFPLLVITVIRIQHLFTQLIIKYYSELSPPTFFISAIISLGSLELVVFIDQVNLRDLGLTSLDSLTTLETLVLPPGVMDLSICPMVCPWLPALPTLRLPSIPLKQSIIVNTVIVKMVSCKVFNYGKNIYVAGISSYRLLNLDDSLEKKEVLAEFNAEVS